MTSRDRAGIDSLVPGKRGCNFQCVIDRLILWINIISTSLELPSDVSTGHHQANAGSGKGLGKASGNKQLSKSRLTCTVVSVSRDQWVHQAHSAAPEKFQLNYKVGVMHLATRLFASPGYQQLWYLQDKFGSEIFIYYACSLNYTTIFFFDTIQYIDGVVYDCSDPIANAMEILQSCTNPSIDSINIRNNDHNRNVCHSVLK